MRNSLWVITILVAISISFFIGYSASKKTGVEPGFFEAVETGSYGASAGSEGTEGISSEDEKYYQDLTKE